MFNEKKVTEIMLERMFHDVQMENTDFHLNVPFERAAKTLRINPDVLKKYFDSRVLKKSLHASKGQKTELYDLVAIYTTLKEYELI